MESSPDEYVNQEIISLAKKTKSTPAKKPEDKLVLPKNLNDLLDKIEQCIIDKHLTNFRYLISKRFRLITENILKEILKNFILLYKEDRFIFQRFFMCLLEFIEDPNIIIDMHGNKESLLMLLCELSNYKFISILYNKKNLDVNYEDSKGRNALFYFKGENEDNDDKIIIDSLIKQKIKVDIRDTDGNTVLHYYAINNRNIKLIYKLIDSLNINLLIKNNENKSILEVISENILSKKKFNPDKNIVLFDLKEINKLIQLIKKKLLIKPKENLPQKYIEINMSPHSQNFFKIPLISFNKNIIENEKNSDTTLENNIYLNIKKNPSLIINNTRFEERKNNISFSEKIKNYKLTSANKKLFLDILKKSENNLKEAIKQLKANIEEKKKELPNKENELKLAKTKNKNSEKEYNNNLKIIISRIDQIKNKINQLKPKIGNYAIEIYNNTKYIIKNQLKIKEPKEFRNLFAKYTVDLNDYRSHIKEKNELLKIDCFRIFNILTNYVNECFEGKYSLEVYGSRATGLCLPWSDIDCCLIRNRNNYYYMNEIPSVSDLEQLYYYIRSSFNDIKFIDQTKIPIIKITINNKYKVDISVETSSNQGLKCVEYIKGKIIKYPSLEPLTFALKAMFHHAKLDEPFSGGLSSYGIILLIIYFLNYYKNKGNDISINNVGELFYSLLCYYKTPTNLIGKMLYPEKGCCSKLSDSESLPFIVDPNNHSNNVSKNAREINKIIFIFSLSLKAIQERCECGCHFQHEISIGEEHCSHNILNRIFRVLKDIDIYYDLEKKLK